MRTKARTTQAELNMSAREFALFEKGKTIVIRVAGNHHVERNVRRGRKVDINSKISREVLDVRRYPSLEEMLEYEDPEHIFPGYGKDKVLATLRQTYNENQDKRGVLAIILAPSVK